MLQRQPVNPPQYIYPIDPWRIVEKRFYPRYLAQTETVFSMANGYLGMRGSFEEGSPTFENGTFINGFYETWPIAYAEEAHGFAKEGQTIVNVTDTKIIKLFVDDEPFLLEDGNLASFQRVLDMQAGTLERDIIWEMPSGKRIQIKSTRLVSYEHHHEAAITYEVTLLNASAPVTISSEMCNDPAQRLREGDPRLSQSPKGKVLLPWFNSCREERVVLGHITEKSKLKLVAGIDHLMETACEYSARAESAEDEGKVVFSIKGQEGVPIKLTKFIVYHASRDHSDKESNDWIHRTLDRAKARGFAATLAAQRQYLDKFWRRSDVRIEGDPDNPEHRVDELQQALRFNLFQIFQASIRAGDWGIPAKGLTGQAYDGNYFWDTETYVLPFLDYTYPRIARNLLNFRYRMLDKARQRAQEVNEEGALFPWRTIDGQEASAYYAAGTAQYHINGDIMYALQKYVEVTGDEQFLFEKGAEMLVETARMWFGLGFFSERRDGQFCIHGVTGPDEYTTVVDNNLYTNLIAQNNLNYAVNTVRLLQQKDAELYAVLVDKTDLQPVEIDHWDQAAQRMYIPYDDGLQVHPQDDTFLDKQVWDLDNTPPDKFPLLLYFHPLKIYRQQVIKQADVSLAMFLLGDRFSVEQKRRNFDYYEPLTTGDSSLSVCIESIVALEVGYLDKALEAAYYAVLMDLGNVGGNVKDGCHIASMGGSWMLCTYGFAGMRDFGGNLSFNPRLPRGMKGLHFCLNVQNRVLQVDIAPEATTYRLAEGSSFTIRHQDLEVGLTTGQPVTCPNQS
jgi:alpha,alpha-trehalose phosphorylase